MKHPDVTTIGIIGIDMKAYQERVNAPYWRFIDWDLPKE
jgi:hypothetical protein